MPKDIKTFTPKELSKIAQDLLSEEHREEVLSKYSKLELIEAFLKNSNGRRDAFIIKKNENDLFELEGDILEIILTKHNSKDKMPSSKDLTDILKKYTASSKESYGEKLTFKNIGLLVFMGNADPKVLTNRFIVDSDGFSKRVKITNQDLDKLEYTSKGAKELQAVKRDSKAGTYDRKINLELKSIHENIKAIEKYRKELDKFKSESFKTAQPMEAIKNCRDKIASAIEEINNSIANLENRGFVSEIRASDWRKVTSQILVEKTNKKGEKYEEISLEALKEEFPERFFNKFKLAVLKVCHYVGLIDDKTFAKSHTESLVGKKDAELIAKQVNQKERTHDKIEKSVDKTANNMSDSEFSRKSPMKKDLDHAYDKIAEVGKTTKKAVMDPINTVKKAAKKVSNAVHSAIKNGESAAERLRNKVNPNNKGKS